MERRLSFRTLAPDCQLFRQSVASCVAVLAVLLCLLVPRQASAQPPIPDYDFTYEAHWDPGLGYTAIHITGIKPGRSQKNIRIPPFIIYMSGTEVPNFYIPYPGTVSYIDANAFKDLTAIETVSYPLSLYSIGANAFKGCTNLTSVTPYYNDDDYLVSYPSVTEENIYEYVTLHNIGDGAFEGCSSLPSFLCPPSVNYIGWGAFRNCSNLLTFNLLCTTPPAIGADPFEGVPLDANFICPDGKRDVYTNHPQWEYCFPPPNSAVKLNFRDNLKATVYALDTQHIDWLDQDYSISISTKFYLNRYTVYSITGIDGWAFAGQTLLRSIRLPSTLTAIGDSAFAGCSALTNITIEAITPPKLGIGVFDGISPNRLPLSCHPRGRDNYYYNPQWLAYFSEVPRNYTNLQHHPDPPSYPVLFCITDDDLLAVYAPNPAHPDYNPDSLYIPEGIFINIRYRAVEAVVPGIGGRSFTNNPSLRFISFPSSISVIADSVFAGCTAVDSVSVAAEYPPTLGAGSFDEAIRPAALGCTYATLSAYHFHPRWSFYFPYPTLAPDPEPEPLPDNEPVPTGGDINFTYVRFTSPERFAMVTGLKEGVYPSQLYIPDNISENGYAYKVTYIQTGAFENCTCLEAVRLPSGLTNIRERAFKGCTYLRSVGNIAASCPNLQSIEKEAFMNCTSLISVNFPGNAQFGTVGDRAFQGCKSVSSVTMTGGIPSTVSFGKDLFRGCTALLRVEWPISHDISEGAFRDCSDLRRVTIGNAVTNIGNYAFSGCRHLRSITFPTQLGSIGDYAFSGCATLSSIALPGFINAIGTHAFSYCYNLDTIDISAAPTTPPQLANVNTVFSYTHPFDRNDSQPHVFISVPADSPQYTNYRNHPQWRTFFSLLYPFDFTVTNDGLLRATVTRPFDYTVSSFYFPKYVCYRGNDYRVAAIAPNAFQRCLNLASISLPASLEAIGEYAFDGCRALDDVYFQPLIWLDDLTSIPLSLAPNAFDNTAADPEDTDAEIYLSADDPSRIEFCRQHPQWSQVFSLRYFFTHKLIPPTAGSTLRQGLVTGFHPDSLATFNGQLSLPDSVFRNGRNRPVAAIARSAFQNNASIRSLLLPASLKTIRPFAFQGCTNLTSIVTNALTTIDTAAFSACTSLSSVSPPASLSFLGVQAFAGCTGLSSVTLPAALSSLSAQAFAGCTGLSSVTLPTALSSLGAQTFAGCSSLKAIALPDGLTAIGSRAFERTALETITLPPDIGTIGDGAFARTSLASVAFTPDLTAVGDSVFAHCYRLDTILIPVDDTPPTLGPAAFAHTHTTSTIASPDVSVMVPDYPTFLAYSSHPHWMPYFSATLDAGHPFTFTLNARGEATITGINAAHPDHAPHLVLPNTITQANFSRPIPVAAIAPAAFARTNGLSLVTTPALPPAALPSGNVTRAITLPTVLSVLPDSIFADCTSLQTVRLSTSVTHIGAAAFHGCTSLTEATLPHRITAIAPRAFRGCTALADFTWPTYLTAIGDSAFQGCQLLKQLPLVPLLSTIGTAAFDGCSSVTSLTVARSITAIAPRAFRNCTALCDVLLRPASPPSLGEEAFAGIRTDCRFRAPGAIRAYRTATAWKPYFPAPDYPFLLTVAHAQATVCTVIHPTGLIGDVQIPDTVEFEDDYYPVTAIAPAAFQGCTGITGITLPPSILAIPDSAFAECSALDTLISPPLLRSVGHSAYRNCTALKTATFPSTLRSIAPRAFARCTNLAQITLSAPASPITTTDKIPDPSVPYLGHDAFADCPALKKINIPPQLTSSYRQDPVWSPLIK